MLGVKSTPRYTANTGTQGMFKADFNKNYTGGVHNTVLRTEKSIQDSLLTMGCCKTQYEDEKKESLSRRLLS